MPRTNRQRPARRYRVESDSEDLSGGPAELSQRLTDSLEDFRPRRSVRSTAGNPGNSGTVSDTNQNNNNNTNNSSGWRGRTRPRGGTQGRSTGNSNSSSSIQRHHTFTAARRGGTTRRTGSRLQSIFDETLYSSETESDESYQGESNNRRRTRNNRRGDLSDPEGVFEGELTLGSDNGDSDDGSTTTSSESTNSSSQQQQQPSQRRLLRSGIFTMEVEQAPNASESVVDMDAENADNDQDEVLVVPQPNHADGGGSSHSHLCTGSSELNQEFRRSAFLEEQVRAVTPVGENEAPAPLAASTPSNNNAEAGSRNTGVAVAGTSCDIKPSCSQATRQHEYRPPPPRLNESSFDEGNVRASLSCFSRRSREGEICTICFDEYTNTGKHRLVCIPCGHLFGESCIVKWGASKNVGGGSCPTCKTTFKRRDVRKLFAKAVKSRDISEVEELREKLAAASKERNRLMQELAEAKQLASAMKKREGDDLRYEIAEKGMAKLSRLMEFEKNRLRMKIQNLYAAIEICKSNECRVMSISNLMNRCVVNYYNPSPVLRGHHIRYVDIPSFQVMNTVKLHSDKIRDLKFNESGQYLLSASHDKTLCLTSMALNQETHRMQSNFQFWSAGFTKDPNIIVGGTNNGKVLMYDLRKSNEILLDCSELMDGAPNRSPISSMHWMTDPLHERQGHSGLLVGHLRGVYYYEYLGENGGGAVGSSSKPFKIHPLSIADGMGGLSSLCHDQISSHFMATFRPGGVSGSSVTHKVCDLVLSADGKYSSRTVEELNGGSLQSNLVRNSIATVKPNQLITAVYNQSDDQIHLHEVGRSLEANLKFASSPGTDKMQVNLHNLSSASGANNNDAGTLLTILTNSKIHFHKLVYDASNMAS